MRHAIGNPAELHSTKSAIREQPTASPNRSTLPAKPHQQTLTNGQGICRGDSPGYDHAATPVGNQPQRNTAPDHQYLPDQTRLVLPPGWSNRRGDSSARATECPAEPSRHYRRLYKLTPDLETETSSNWTTGRNIRTTATGSSKPPKPSRYCT